MKVLLIGYGRMGKEVHEVLKSRNHEVVKIIDQNNLNDLNELDANKIDVAIEFTQPDVAFDNITKCLSQKIPAVTGTTGWNEKLNDAAEICKTNKTAFLYASNFSIGVNLLFAMNEKLAALMNNHNQYNALITETHHIHKKDKPSGTAVTLAEQLVENINRYKSFELDSTDQNVLPVHAIREGEVFGDHEISYKSEIDELKLSHSAKSRKGFALGAVLAAEFIQSRKGVFTMKDVLKIN
jgi:4-hydroxy-tetrahydrodipicolinate reductase